MYLISHVTWQDHMTKGHVTLSNLLAIGIVIDMFLIFHAIS